MKTTAKTKRYVKLPTITETRELNTDCADIAAAEFVLAASEAKARGERLVCTPGCYQCGRFEALVTAEQVRLYFETHYDHCPGTGGPGHNPSAEVEAEFAAAQQAYSRAATHWLHVADEMVRAAESLKGLHQFTPKAAQ